MARTVLLILVALVLFNLYAVCIVYGGAFPMGVIDPPWWESMFPSRGAAALTWLFLHHTIAVILVSLPFACVLRLLYGRHSVLVALTMGVLIVLMDVPGLISYFPNNLFRRQLVAALDQITLIGTLPMLAWAINKLPSNYRKERSVSDKLSNSSVSARGAHAER